MAGLGETCTHVAVMLFYLEGITRIQGAETCTQKECEWLVPLCMKNIEYQFIKNIDFTSASVMKRKLDKMIADDSDQDSLEETFVSKGNQLTDSEMRELFEKSRLTDTKPTIHSLVAPYSKEYIPKS